MTFYLAAMNYDLYRNFRAWVQELEEDETSAVAGNHKYWVVYPVRIGLFTRSEIELPESYATFALLKWPELFQHTKEFYYSSKS